MGGARGARRHEAAPPTGFGRPTLQLALGSRPKGGARGGRPAPPLGSTGPWEDGAARRDPRCWATLASRGPGHTACPSPPPSAAGASIVLGPPRSSPQPLKEGCRGSARTNRSQGRGPAQGRPQAPQLWALPELDVEHGRLREVRHTLHVDHLLHLRAPIHRRVHGLGLQAQMCPCQGGHCNMGTVSPGPRGKRRARGG